MVAKEKKKKVAKTFSLQMKVINLATNRKTHVTYQPQTMQAEKSNVNKKSKVLCELN